MKPLNWVELTRQQIKARYGFVWSIQGIEKQNKVITNIVYRYQIPFRKISLNYYTSLFFFIVRYFQMIKCF